jgi:2-polyprenyl-6-methoxyphenol hydroxylase-like FAD-dependent oxidoreductase
MASSSGSALVCGASVAGPVTAYWLHRYGFDVTVVERAPTLRSGLGGHAVDLFGASVDLMDRMGLLPQVLAARTRTETLRFERAGKRPIDIDFAALTPTFGDRHVEIMRGELVSLLYGATRDSVAYLFGDSVTALDHTGEHVRVQFEHAPPRSYDIVIGADGLHSTVRRLILGEEKEFLRPLGGYFCVFTLPNYLHLAGLMRIYTLPGKVAAIYPVRQTGEARAVLLFRCAEQFSDDQRDVGLQKELVRRVFDGGGWEIPRLMTEMEAATEFYFDSISQVRTERWSKNRVGLVGDAAYSPGPAVGGGTTAAVVGAYVLAGELSAAAGDHVAGFRAYEEEMREFVDRSLAIGPAVMRAIVPRTSREVWLAAQMLRFLPRLPAQVLRTVGSLQTSPARALKSITLKRYATVR